MIEVMRNVYLKPNKEYRADIPCSVLKQSMILVITAMCSI